MVVNRPMRNPSQSQVNFVVRIRETAKRHYLIYTVFPQTIQQFNRLVHKVCVVAVQSHRDEHFPILCEICSTTSKKQLPRHRV